MKASQVASVVAALCAQDAKPTEATILAAILAADKKAKDNTGMGPKELEEKDQAKDKSAKDKAKDEMEEKAEDEKDDKAEDEKDDPEHTNDEDIDGMDDIQPTKSANGNSGAGGKEPAKDAKAMDARIQSAIDARDALHAARRDVEPVLGVVTFDTAAQVYKAALAKLNIATDVHPSAYPALFKMARDKADAAAPVFATDAARVSTMAGAIKGYDRLR